MDDPFRKTLTSYKVRKREPMLYYSQIISKILSNSNDSNNWNSRNNSNNKNNPGDYLKGLPYLGGHLGILLVTR